MDEQERAFHDSWKPSWDARGTLIFAQPSNGTHHSTQRADRGGLFVIQKGSVASESREVKFARLSSEASP